MGLLSDARLRSARLERGCIHRRDMEWSRDWHVLAGRHWGPPELLDVMERDHRGRLGQLQHPTCVLHNAHSNTHHATTTSVHVCITCHSIPAAVFPRCQQRCGSTAVTAPADIAPCSQHREGVHTPPHIPPWNLQIPRAAPTARRSGEGCSVHAC